MLLFVLTIAFFRVYNLFQSKINIETGIQESTYIPIGGIEQYVQIRGEDKDNPVILWLHGGPGFPLTYLTYYYQSALEKDYTIVDFEQRGCGRTFYQNEDNGNLTLEQLLSDTNEVIEYLLERFDKYKIIIIGQSWGTVLGTEYINIHPEKISAYIGVGQVVDFSEGKIYAAGKAIEEAKKSDNTEDINTLERGIKQLSETKNVEELDVKSLEDMIIVTSKYLKSDGEMSGIKQIFTAITSPEMLIQDAKWFMYAGNSLNIIASQKSLVDYMYFQFDIRDLNDTQDIPICYIQGESDYITPTDLVEEYCSSVLADNKQLIKIVNAGHTPFLDNPNEFCSAVKTFLSESEVN
jgi:pimeloyl-ACP methyl ester carboxylesterase